MVSYRWVQVLRRDHAGQIDGRWEDTSLSSLGLECLVGVLEQTCADFHDTAMYQHTVTLFLEIQPGNSA